MKHFALETPSGWFVAYNRPGRRQVVLVLDCPSESVAKEQAYQMNKDFERRRTAIRFERKNVGLFDSQ